MANVRLERKRVRKYAQSSTIEERLAMLQSMWQSSTLGKATHIPAATGVCLVGNRYLVISNLCDLPREAFTDWLALYASSLPADTTAKDEAISMRDGRSYTANVRAYLPRGLAE